MSQKVYLWILKIGVLLSLTTVFYVFKNLLFPFITSKQIPFNIMVEVMAVFWVALIVKYPEYRPKANWIGFGLVGFFAALVLSSVFGVDFNLSFWGDIERMLGVFHLLHFLVYYFIIITVFREWKDWKMFLIFSVLCAVGVSFHGLKNTHYATIGNTAYVSGYLIFNFFFVALLFTREKNQWLKWAYLITLIPMFLEFNKANTGGAWVGLGIAVIFALFLYGVLAWRHLPGKNGKWISIAMITLFVVGTMFITWTFVLDRDNFLTRTFPGFGSIVKDVNFHKNTFQTRLISWRAAWKDFKQHPILGTGHGNYAVIFDKYFDPKFYDYTRSETYFDRAHNNVIDIASTSGLVGLLTYLSIFAAVAWYLIRGYWSRRISLNDFVLLSSLIVAYFIQNLAVFDSLVTYVGLMVALGFIYWNYEIEEKLEPAGFDNQGRGRLTPVVGDRSWDNGEIYSLSVAGVVILAIMYQFNILPWKMLVGTIDGQRYWSQGDVEGTITAYQKALSYHTVLDRDSRTSLNRLFAGGAGVFRNIGKDRAVEIMDYNIELAEENVAYNEHDSMNQMILAQLLNSTAAMVADDQEKFAYYSDQALAAIDKSIEASPGRVPIYYQKAQIQITRGQKEEALDTLRYALSLNPQYYDSSCHLARTLTYFGQEDEAWQYYDSCIDLGGANLLSPAATVYKLVEHYSALNDKPKVIELYKQATQVDAKNVKNWIELAQLYIEAGNKNKAVEAVNKAVEVDPSIKDYAEKFLNSL